MTFLSTWFNPTLLYSAWLPFIFCLLFAGYRLHRTPQPIHPTACLVTTCLLALLWLMNVQMDGGHLNGMSYHLLTLNLASLMLGAPATFLLGSAWLLAFGIMRQGNTFLPVYALNALCIILPACGINALLRRIALTYLPKHLFIYIFVNGFISGAIGMLLTGSIIATLLQTHHVFSGSIAWHSAFPIFFLLSWGEAFLSGIACAICVALKPELLSTFSDKVYLTHKNEIWK